MSNYLMTLTPVGSYYFGGERSFSVGKNDENELASYIVESNLFPQQTSLLGMLRFWILRNIPNVFDVINNCISDKTKAVEYIDKSSFCANQEQTFGKIVKIHYCFLRKEIDNVDVNILPSPLDYGLDIDFNNSVQTAFYNSAKKRLPTIHYPDDFDTNGKPKLFSTKDGLVKRYISSDGKYVFKESDIFIKDRRIGIDRDVETGTVEDKALYKQIYYRLADGFRFAFIVEFKNDYQLPPKGQIVELGGDSSKFVLQYETWDKKPEIEFNPGVFCSVPKGVFSKIILLSDTKLDNTVVEENTLFSIAEHVPFEFLKFNTETETNYSRTLNDGKRSVRYSLFKRSSVFYFEDIEKLNKFKNEINNTIFKNIGYNKYQIK